MALSSTRGLCLRACSGPDGSHRTACRSSGAEDQGQNDGDQDIDDDRIHSHITWNRQTKYCDRISGTLKGEQRGHPCPKARTCCPTDQEGPAVEKAPAQPKDECRQDLNDPHATQQLQLDGIFERKRKNEDEGARFHDQ
jgi:hypothetical protein